MLMLQIGFPVQADSCAPGCSRWDSGSCEVASWCKCRRASKRYCGFLSHCLAVLAFWPAPASEYSSWPCWNDRLQAHDTPVHEASRNGNLECLRALLDAKADIHAENKVCHEGWFGLEQVCCMKVMAFSLPVWEECCRLHSRDIMYGRVTNQGCQWLDSLDGWGSPSRQ